MIERSITDLWCSTFAVCANMGIDLFGCIDFNRTTLCYSAGLCESNVSVRLSCLSVTHWYCVKTKKASVMISSLSGGPMILVF